MRPTQYRTPPVRTSPASTLHDSAALPPLASVDCPPYWPTGPPHLPPRGAVLNRTPTPTHAAAALQKASSAAVAQFFLPRASFFMASSPPRPFPLLEFSYLSSTTRDPAIASESHSEVAAAIAGEGLSSCCSSPIHGWLASSSPTRAVGAPGSRRYSPRVHRSSSPPSSAAAAPPPLIVDNAPR
jgi:hypothetical protein